MVELIVALAIIGVVATAFALLVVSTIGTARTHEQRVAANQIGQNQLESVVSKPWSAIGLYSGDSGYSATGANGETTVTLSGTAPATSIKPLSPVPKGGINYSVRTDITWTDDPGDGLGAADANGSTQDDKHVVVTVSWGTRSITLDDLRTPTASEAPPVSGAGFTVTMSAPSSQSLGATGMFVDPGMTVTAATTKVAGSVTLKWGTRDGQQHSATMANISGGTSWRVTLPGTTTGPFDTKPTTFSVAAATGSQNASNTATVQLVGSGTSTASLNVTAAPSQTLSSAGNLTGAITITATGSATISSGTVQYNTTGGTSVTRNLSGSGTSWSYTVPVDAAAYDAGLEVFTVSVTFGDNTTRNATDSITLNPAILLPDVTNLVVNPSAGTFGFCADGSYRLFLSTTIDATVKNVATTDAVYLTAPAWMTAPGLQMTYLKTNVDGSMVFRYTAAASTQLPAVSSIQLQASASKTVNGSPYSDNFVTNPNVAIQTGANKSKCS
jgi:type II secretory pathway pseudopilin PulG